MSFQTPVQIAPVIRDGRFLFKYDSQTESKQRLYQVVGDPGRRGTEAELARSIYGQYEIVDTPIHETEPLVKRIRRVPRRRAAPIPAPARRPAMGLQICRVVNPDGTAKMKWDEGTMRHEQIYQVVGSQRRGTLGYFEHQYGHVPIDYSQVIVDR